MLPMDRHENPLLHAMLAFRLSTHSRFPVLDPKVSHDWSDPLPLLLVAFMSSTVASNQAFKSPSFQVPSLQVPSLYSATWPLGHLATRLLGSSATRLLTLQLYKLINYLMLLIKPFSIAMISSNSGINLRINSLSP